MCTLVIRSIYFALLASPTRGSHPQTHAQIDNLQVNRLTPSLYTPSPSCGGHSSLCSLHRTSFSTCDGLAASRSTCGVGTPGGRIRFARFLFVFLLKNNNNRKRGRSPSLPSSACVRSCVCASFGASTHSSPHRLCVLRVARDRARRVQERDTHTRSPQIQPRSRRQCGRTVEKKRGSEEQREKCLPAQSGAPLHVYRLDTHAHTRHVPPNAHLPERRRGAALALQRLIVFFSPLGSLPPPPSTTVRSLCQLYRLALIFVLRLPSLVRSLSCSRSRSSSPTRPTSACASV